MQNSALLRLFLGLACLAGCLFVRSLPAHGEEALSREAIQKILSQPQLKPGQPLEELQKVCRGSLVPLMLATSIEEWEKCATQLREQILGRVVFRGAAEQWQYLRAEPVWQETIPGGPGYSIRKLRFEAVPGMWIPALLYIPHKLEGKVPVVLAVNGHDRHGKSAKYKQERCINLVKRGMLVLNLEWLGMGQLKLPDFGHSKMNQLDLVGTSGIAPFFLSMRGGIDILLAQPHADPARVAVSGLSGGGWQTIFISALDPRVTLCNPVAGYADLKTRIANFDDLGDSEQTPVDLAKYADYTHLTALLAPRPALLTYNAKDECCFKADRALPPLMAAGRPYYDLYGKIDFLRSHVNHDPGTHNYLQENREAYYKLIGDFFFKGDKQYLYPEIPTPESEFKTAQELQVALPPENAGFNRLALKLANRVPLVSEVTKHTPHTQEEFDRISHFDVFSGYFPRNPSFRISTYHENQGIPRQEGTLTIRTDEIFVTMPSGAFHLPVTTFTPRNPLSATLIVADKGRPTVADLVQAHLSQGESVSVMDLMGQGELNVGKYQWLYDLLISSQGGRPLEMLVNQFDAVQRVTSFRSNQSLTVIARGPVSSLIVLLAVRAPGSRIQNIELHESLGTLKELLEKNVSVEELPELFCFGLLQHTDILHLTKLAAANTKVTFINPTDRVRRELEPLRKQYQVLGSDHDPLPPAPTKK